MLSLKVLEIVLKLHLKLKAAKFLQSVLLLLQEAVHFSSVLITKLFRGFNFSLESILFSLESSS